MTVLSCPVCAGAMREIARDGVLIDTCTQCRGVWLDRGELEKIAAAVAAPPVQSGFLPREITQARHAREDRSDDRRGDHRDERMGNRESRRFDHDDDDDDDDRRRQSGQRPSRTKSFLDFFD